MKTFSNYRSPKDKVMFKAKKSINKILEVINNANPFIIAIILFCFFVITGIIDMRFVALSCDMGEFCNNPVRILAGDLPYRDFWLLFSPGEVYVPALIYKIFGVNTEILINSFIIMSALTASFSFYVGKYILKTNTPAVIFSLLFFFISVVSIYEGPGYNNLYLTCILISFFFIIKHFKTCKLIYLFLAGLLAGAGFFFRIYEVGAAIIGFTLAIIIYYFLFKIKTQQAIKNLILYFLGMIIVPIITLLVFNGIAHRMINEIFFESVKNGTSMDIPMFSIIWDLKPNITLDYHALITHGAIISILKLLVRFSLLFSSLIQIILVIVGIIFFIFYLKTKPEKIELAIAVLFFLWGLISYPKGLGRSDLPHFAPANCPMSLFILYATVTLIRRKKSTSIQISKILKVSGTIIISILLLSIIDPYSKIFNFTSTPLFILNTERGIIRNKNKSYIIGLDSTFKIINRYTKPGDYIFVTPWDAPPFYALTGRRDPTYYDSMNDLLVRPSDEKQRVICNDIISRNTKLIIHDPKTGYTSEQEFDVACKILQNFIVKNFKYMGQYGEYQIYKR